MRFKIIHTNDIHSSFEDFAKAVTVIKQHQDDFAFTLDGGDFADFKSIELQGTQGLAAIELLEAAGYDALTIGNNEMFNGVDTLELMASSSPYPFISNNLLKKDGSAIDGVHKSAILEKNGLRILVTGSSPDMGEFCEGLGISITPFKEAIVEEISKHKGQYDLCLLLSHLSTGFDEVLAEEIPEIDVIISAHDHKCFAEAKIIGNTIHNSAGNFGEHVGILELEYVNGELKLLNSQTLPTKEVEQDKQTLEILRRNKEKAIEVLSQPLYDLKKPLWHDVVEENPLTNLIADGLRDMLDCEIGLINSGICNAGVFSYISNKKLIEICPSPLNPTYLEIQGKYIREALQQSLDAQSCLADGRGPGFRGRFVGRLHIAGGEILHDGKNVKKVLIAGKALEDERWYTVATSDYLQRGSGYASLAHNRHESYRPEHIKDVIRAYASQEDFVEKAYQNRCKEL